MPLLFRRPSNRRGESSRGTLDLTAQEWVGVLLIGLAAALAAIFGWRAASIGSTAAFDDRQAISETIKVQQQRIDVGLDVADDAREYSRYLAEYAVAAELDNQAEGLEAAGNAAAAGNAHGAAQALRRDATERAADAGVFGPFSIASDLRSPSPEPRPFDFDAQLRAVRAEQATAFDSPGNLDPGVWAVAAESIRDRIEGLAVWSLILLVAVLLLTIAQVNMERRPLYFGCLALGVAALLVGAIGGFTTDFFA